MILQAKLYGSNEIVEVEPFYFRTVDGKPAGKMYKDVNEEDVWYNDMQIRII